MNSKFKYEDFEIDIREPLGEGGFGAVYKATEKNTGKIYAIKRIKIEDLNEEEIKIMELLNECENSIKLIGYFKEKNFYYLIMEKCDYSLDKKIKEKKKLNIKEIKELLEQLNNVFKIMYNNGIIHRDIKPNNILIKKLEDNKNLYKLTDFGLSKELTESFKASTVAGTEYYMAPEIKYNLNIDKSKVDLWSIGILIHQLYFGNPPINNVIQKTNNIYLDDLIKKLLIEKPFDENISNCRISWKDYFEHNFFKKNYKKEIESFKNSLQKFNNTIKEMLNFITNKSNEFYNLINEEIEKIVTDEYNENIKKLTKIMNEFEFNFNNVENSIKEMFGIFNKSIFNSNEILEYKIYLDKFFLYEGEVIKWKRN